jgi:hypothetical protein
MARMTPQEKRAADKKYRDESSARKKALRDVAMRGTTLPEGQGQLRDVVFYPSKPLSIGGMSSSSLEINVYFPSLNVSEKIEILERDIPASVLDAWKAIAAEQIAAAVAEKAQIAATDRANDALDYYYKDDR